MRVNQITTRSFELEIKLTIADDEERIVKKVVQLPTGRLYFDEDDMNIEFFTYVPPADTLIIGSKTTFVDNVLYSGPFAEKFGDGVLGWMQEFDEVTEDNQCNLYASRSNYARITDWEEITPTISVASGIQSLDDASLFKKYTSYKFSRNEAGTKQYTRSLSDSLHSSFQFEALRVKLKREKSVFVDCSVLQNFTSFATLERQLWSISCDYTGPNPFIHLTATCGIPEDDYACVGPTPCKFKVESQITTESGICQFILTGEDKVVKTLSKAYQAVDGHVTLDLATQTDGETNVTTEFFRLPSFGGGGFDKFVKGVGGVGKAVGGAYGGFIGSVFGGIFGGLFGSLGGAGTFLLIVLAICALILFL